MPLTNWFPTGTFSLYLICTLVNVLAVSTGDYELLLLPVENCSNKLSKGVA